MIETPEEKAKHRVRQLIWLYFWLLLVEGALRKWVMPRFSNPLLLIRDPVMLGIYFYAIKAHVFPRNVWVASLWIIAFLSLVASILLSTFNALSGYVPVIPILEVTLYGIRTNFLHLPLIFVIASVFDEEDVKKFGWWTLLMMIPMGLLMAAQFKASPDSFINRTAGLGEAEQLTAGGGKIRPPGSFSFISGPVFYMSVAAAFLIYGALRRTVYNNWLLISSGAALLLGIFISGSKSTVASVLLVVFAVIIILIVRPRAVNRFGWTLVIVVIGALIVSRLPIFKEGFQILSDRFASAAEAAETTIIRGTIDRVISGFTEGLQNIDKFPAFGYGLGIGTNVGGRILIGRPAFLLAENEWSRVLAEGGPILGLAFLVWRTFLTLQLGRLSFAALKRGNLLPILLFSSGFVLLLNGQLGQPTTLGFTVIVNGLCLAATRPRVTDSSATAPTVIDQPAVKSLPRRSAFANRLHGPEIGAEHNNGSADR
ncbi:MAG: hypothetical protein QOF93_762 [Verrucomicrobiota bacterium]